MHVHVHRPVVCHTCSAEMAEHAHLEGWLVCGTCGTLRDWSGRPRVGREVTVTVSPDN